MIKRITTLLLALCILVPMNLGAKNPRKGLSVMSYNIRVSDKSDGTNAWEYRYPASAMMIDESECDVIGIQEALYSQYMYLLDVFDKKYKGVGSGAEDGKKEGQINGIIYNYKTVSLQKWGTFWLSDTCDKASPSWDSEENRTVTWACFKDKANGAHFMVFNTRLDEDSEEGRNKSMDLISMKMQELNKDNLPIIFMGDFGVDYKNECFDVFRKDLKNARNTAVISDDSHSFHGWGRVKKTIDHILFNGFSSCTVFETNTKPYDDRTFISDHYPIKATLIY